MTTYKLSLVVPGRRDIGAIQNFEEEPRIGALVYLGKDEYEITSIVELMPPRGNFVYLHATCRPVEKK
ncbi:MAG: hypothetical protein AB1801_26055 [Chloroflexota bacterium]